MRRTRLFSLIGGFLSLLLPETGRMAVIPVDTSVGSLPCILGNLPCPGGGAGGFATYVGVTLFGGAQIVFLAASIIMFALYGVRLMMESSDESTITEVKSAYTYGIAGAAIVSLTSLIVQVVGQYGTNTTTLVNSTLVGTTLGKIVFFIRVSVGMAVSAVVVYQGFRLIILQGEESEIEQQKKRFFHTLIGVAIITLASAVVTDFVPAIGGGTGSSTDLADQMVGIANYLMVIIGGLTVLAFIIAGLMLVLSTDEALKDRAKKAIFAAVVGMIIVLCVYVIINFIITGLNPEGFIVFPSS